MSLALARTRSPEFSVAESLPVQATFPPDDLSTLNSGDEETEEEANKTIWPPHVVYLVLFCAFITSLSFGTTQVPLLYVFRLMECDAYYEENSPDTLEYSQAASTSMSMSSTQSFTSLLVRTLNLLASHYSSGSSTSFFSLSSTSTDRCALRPIESATALSVSLLGASTTVFGLVNLFLTGHLIKRIGVKSTLVINVFFPALRLVVQNIGVEVWGRPGILIVQASQIVVILGGPSGYLLALNTFITEVVEHEWRTAALGRLMGAMMMGSAIGFLLGGYAAEAISIKAPFRLTLILFILACIYAIVALPNIKPAVSEDEGDKKKKAGRMLGEFFAPLKVFAPRKYVRKDGTVKMEYGALLLAWGVFLGILATGYLQTLLQLYATDKFDFGTTKNGWLIFMYSTLRGLFLTFAFPKLISLGRKLTVKGNKNDGEASIGEEEGTTEREPLLKAQKYRENGHDAPNKDLKQKDDQRFTFDLTYSRFSLLADGLLTVLCTFVFEGWQMYLVAAVLPFAAGTGSAAKGSMLQFLGGSASSVERTDALAGISLVEHMARLSTIFAFGVVYAGFSKIGRPELTFICNAGVALIGFGVLLMTRFPPEGSHRLEKEGDET